MPRPLQLTAAGQPNVCAYRLNLAAESGEVAKRRDTRKEEIGAALYGRESRKALYFLSNWTLWNRKVKRAILGTDHRIVFIAEFMKICEFSRQRLPR